MSDKSSTNQHFLDLDGMRGILANVVMIFHLGLNTLIAKVTHGLISVAPWGLCVDFFFILSGFVLCNSHSRNPKSISQFFVARVFRLLPLHIVILIIGAPVFYMYTALPLSDIMLNGLGLAAFLDVPLWNVPSWSMQHELFIPLIFFLYFLFLRHPLAYLAGFALSLSAQVWSSYQLALWPEIDHLFVRSIGGLSLGFFAYKLYSVHFSELQTKLPLSVPALMLLYLFVILLSGLFAPLAMTLPLVSVIILWLGVSSRSFLSKGIFNLFGRMSYPIYMIHGLIVLCGVTFVGEYDGSYFWKGLSVILVWVLSYGAMRWVEGPGIRLGKTVSSKIFHS